MTKRRRFGRVRQLPSGRVQARYPGPDGVDRPAPHTFPDRKSAERWLTLKEAELMTGEWIDPGEGTVLLRDYATMWVAQRAGLRIRPRQEYARLVRIHISPKLGGLALADVTPGRVRAWYSGLLSAGVGPVTVAKAYRLLASIMKTAVEDRLIRSSPCQIKGAGIERSPERPTLTLPQVFALASAMPERYWLLVLLATFCSMRWGELGALTRADLDADAGWVHIRHGLVELDDGTLIVGEPKTAAGRRKVAIPANLLPDVRAHLAAFVAAGPDAHVFVGPKGGLLRRANFQKPWRQALNAAGLASRGIHFHDLRHTGNTLTAATGATLPDLMARMGHASSRAALVYLHTNSQRDRLVADALNELLPAPSPNGHVAGTDPVELASGDEDISPERPETLG